MSNGQKRNPANSFVLHSGKSIVLSFRDSEQQTIILCKMSFLTLTQNQLNCITYPVQMWYQFKEKQTGFLIISNMMMKM